MVPFDPSLFKRVVGDILEINPVMKTALAQVFGALDAGQGIDLSGIQNVSVKRTLEKVFSILPLVTHINGERSLHKSSGIKLNTELESVLNKNSSNSLEYAAEEPVSRYTTGQPIPQPLGQQRDEDADSSEDEFGPQLATSSRVRAGRDFNAEELRRAKKVKGLPASATQSDRGEWMTQLPEGRSIFSQATAATGPRKFLNRTVERKLASESMGVNLWTATPEERMEFEKKKAERLLVGCEDETSAACKKPSQINQDVMLHSHSGRAQARLEAVSARYYNSSAPSILKQRGSSGSKEPWDRDRDLGRGSVDQAHLTKVLQGAKNMGDRFAPGV